MRNRIEDKHGFPIFLACLGLFRTAVADWRPPLERFGQRLR